MTLAGSVTAVDTTWKVLWRKTNFGAVWTGCSSEIAPTITSVATITLFKTAS